MTPQLVTALVALATALAAALSFLLRRLMRRRARTTARIELRIPQELTDDNRLEFGLRHVRDGKSEATGQGPLLNSDTWFRQGSGAGLTASVRYTAALGFQFKCFVQFGQMTFDELAALFGRAGCGRGSRSGTRRRQSEEGVVSPYLVPTGDDSGGAYEQLRLSR